MRSPGACELFEPVFTNRENYSISLLSFTGQQSGELLCWASSVVGFFKTPGLAINNDLLGSINKTELGAYPLENGWLKMRFIDTDKSGLTNGQYDGNGVNHAYATQSLTSVETNISVCLPLDSWFKTL